MKALSIRQPWAWAILHAGKDVENREWQRDNPSLHVMRQLIASGARFAIHTGQGMTKAEYADFVETINWMRTDRAPTFPRDLVVPTFDDLPRGGIVGTARVVAYVEQGHGSDWFSGPNALVLADAKPCNFIPLKGARGFFDVPDEIVREALAA